MFLTFQEHKKMLGSIPRSTAHGYSPTGVIGLLDQDIVKTKEGGKDEL